MFLHITIVDHLPPDRWFTINCLDFFLKLVHLPPDRWFTILYEVSDFKDDNLPPDRWFTIDAITSNKPNCLFTTG